LPMAGPRQSSLTNHHQLFALLLAGKALVAVRSLSTCPGTLKIDGFGLAALVPTGWKTPEDAAPVEVHADSQVIPHLNGRAYFANSCSNGFYNPADYLAFNLLGKTMQYTTDLSGSGCGCNAALYLTSMHHNVHPGECSDYYCDANNQCGQSCAEIDLQEANQFAWHSTLHTSTDSSGLGAGYGGGGTGWNGPRTWTAHQYGPNRECIDTTKPFDVAVSFPADVSCQLTSLRVVLSQTGRSCPLSFDIKGYSGMAEMTEALRRGMTPTVSYWGPEDLGWMDVGNDQKGPCSSDAPTACSASVKFYNFSVYDMDGSPCVQNLTNQPPASRSFTGLGNPVMADPSGNPDVAAPHGKGVQPGSGSHGAASEPAAGGLFFMAVPPGKDVHQGSGSHGAGSEQAAGDLLSSKVAAAAEAFIVGFIVTCAVVIAIAYAKQRGSVKLPPGLGNMAICTETSTKVHSVSDSNGDVKRTQPSSVGLLATGTRVDAPIKPRKGRNYFSPILHRLQLAIRQRCGWNKCHENDTLQVTVTESLFNLPA